MCARWMHPHLLPTTTPNSKTIPMNRILLAVAIALLPWTLCAQQPVAIAKKATLFLYQTFEYGEHIDTSAIHVTLTGDNYLITTPEEKGPFVPGYATEQTLVAPAQDSVFEHLIFTNSTDEAPYEVASAFARSDIHFDTSVLDNGLTRYTCSINSNKLEFYVQPYAIDLNPVPYYGRFHGIVVSFWRNGQCRLQLANSGAPKSKIAMQTPIPALIGGPFQRVTSRQLAQIKRQKMIITHRIFHDEQICWGKTNDHISDNGDGTFSHIPADSVLHFAGGTLLLKKVKLPRLPQHYQTFLELHQHSNGDAYDRTGSVFVIPSGAKTFFDGINQHPDSLPLRYGRDGERYQGITAVADLGYQPPIELMRFFTPFGVGHFNDRVKIEGLEWADECFYKQEVTELQSLLQGDEVLIGIWIGNYDGGGHKVTLDLKSYPGDYIWEITDRQDETMKIQSLFNTCNVLEMAGQNYGKIFGTDSLTMEFEIPEGAHNVRLRYISTGHGGWDGGDEFNPKANTLLIDGAAMFVHTPWRGDCGCYRHLNPVSGNFWNGVSSSDYSRSGWCPGTATQPVYFDLSSLTPGKHTLTIAIPMGAPQAGSFSHWCISGVLLCE